MIDSDLEMLRRIDPAGSLAGELGGVDLEAAWREACDAVTEIPGAIDLWRRGQMDRA